MRSELLAPPRVTARRTRPARPMTAAHLVRASRVVGTLLVGATLVSACGAGGPEDADDHDVPEVYITVIRALAPIDTLMPKVVFVEARPGTKLSLEDQATIVKALGDATDVRFIDDRAEAVDDKAPLSRVRRDGVLLQMNPVEESAGTLRIKTTRYVSRDDDTTRCMELEAIEDGWEIASSQTC